MQSDELWLPSNLVVCPFGHCLHVDCLFSSWYVPLMHETQSPTDECVPYGQSAKN